LFRSAPRRGGPPGRPAPGRRGGRRGRRGRRASARAARATGSSPGSSLASSSPVPTRDGRGTHRRADVRARPGTRTAPTRRCIPARTAVLTASPAPPSGPASDSASTAAAVTAQVRAGRYAVRSSSASSAQPASPAASAAAATAAAPTCRTSPAVCADGPCPATGPVSVHSASAAAAAPATVRARRTRTGTRVWTRAGTRVSSVMSVPFVIGPGRWRPGPGSVAGRVRPAHRAGGQGGTVRRRGRTPTLVGAAAARRGSSLCPMDDDTPAAPWPWALRRWPWTLRRRTGAALVLALTGPLIAATVWARHHGGAEEGALWPDAAAGSAAWLLSPLLLWRPVAVAAALTALAAV